MIIEGASWTDDRLAINEGESMVVGRSQVRWVHIDHSEEHAANTTQVSLPVYLNADRSDVLFTINLPFTPSDAALSVVRAVCLNAGGSASA